MLQGILLVIAKIFKNITCNNPMSFIEKTKKWLDNRYNLILVVIILFALFLRLKYFDINHLSLWWDEATYLATGRYWAFGETLWAVEAARPPFFMLLIALFYKLGLGEIGIRFFTVVIPSLFIVFFTYLLGKEFYNEKVGLIAALLASVSWMFLFNISRVHSDLLAVVFGLGAIYFFWKGYVTPEKNNAFYLILIGLFLGLGYLTRLSNLLVLGIIGFYLIITEQHKFLKRNGLWYALIALVLISLPYMIWGHFHYGSYIPWAAQYGAGAGDAVARPLAWNVFTVTEMYLVPAMWPWLGKLASIKHDFILYALFFVGLLVTLRFLLGIDVIIKNKDKNLNADLMTCLIVLITFMFFVVIQRDLGDPRWQMFAAPGMFLIIGRGVIWLYDYFKKYSKAGTIIILFILLFIGSISQITQNDSLLKGKMTGEAGIKSAAEWIKQNSEKGDWILSNNIHAEMTYWADRPTRGFGRDEEDTLKVIEEIKPVFLVTTSYFNSLDWTYELPSKHTDLLTPVAAFDIYGKPLVSAEQNPTIVVYRVNI